MRKGKLRKFNVCVSFTVKDEAGFLAMGLKVFKVDNYDQPHNIIMIRCLLQFLRSITLIFSV